MDEQQDWTEWLKKLPNWIKAAIGLVTVIIGLIVLLQENPYLGVTVSVVIVLVAAFFFCVYVAFRKINTGLIGVNIDTIYRFSNYRHLALAGIILITVIAVGLVTYKPTRSYAKIAFVGTPTPTHTHTPAPTNTPALIPTPTEFLYTVLVIDGVTEKPIKNASVTIELAGRSPKRVVTGNDGRSAILIPSAYMGQLGKLFVKADKYKSYEVDINLDKGISQPVLLEKATTPTVTSTWTPTATPTDIPTSIPTSTNTPLPTPTSTDTTTPTPIPTATNTPTTPAAIPTLISPEDGESVSGEVTFTWQWGGLPLPEDQGFEVRIWRGDEDHYGAYDARERGDVYPKPDGTYEHKLSFWIEDAPGVNNRSGDYFWTVAVVQLQTDKQEYKRIGEEASPFRITVVVIVEGGNSKTKCVDPRC